MLYAVCLFEDSTDGIKDRATAQYGANVVEVNEGVFLVSATDQISTVAKHLGIRLNVDQRDRSSGVIFELAGKKAGFGPSVLVDWIAQETSP